MTQTPKTSSRRTGRRRWLTPLLLLIAGVLIGRFACSAPAPPASPDQQAPAAVTEWTCSMHPQIRRAGPGACPICGMDLVPVEADGGGRDVPVLRMSPEAMALADIETAPVERRPVAHEVRMVGRVAHDETRLSHVTARVGGRLDRLYIDYTGVAVRAGDHMAEIYSPALIATQQELLQAVATAAQLEGGSVSIVKERTAASVRSARERLRLWGLEPAQIDEVVARGVPLEHVLITSPVGGVVVDRNALEGAYVETGTRIYTIADLTHVWVLLDAYESDLAWLRYGQLVQFATEAYPGEVFEARIAFIDPVLDDRTRTVKVRLNVDNADGRLKPDMFVRARVQAALTPQGRVVDAALEGKWMCPMHPEITADELVPCSECGMDLVPVEELGFVSASTVEVPLVIPATAPLITGERAVVYVRVPDTEEPVFEGRVVVLGPRAGDAYVVREGLVEGEQVVVRGNFKIDSELQIRGLPSMMNPVDETAGEPLADEGSELSVPEDVRRQLGRLVDGYLSVQAALAADDLAAARTAAGGLTGRIDAVDMSRLDGEAHDAWMERRSRLLDAVRELSTADAIEGQRTAFRALSDALATTLRTLGYVREDGAVAVYRCPMAFDSSGGEWLQPEGAVQNPYFGSSMLRCGDFVGELTTER